MMASHGVRVLISLVVLTAACDQQKPSRAHPALAGVLKEAATFHAQGSKLLKGGKAGEAITPLRRAIRLGRLGPKVQGELGRALLATGQVHEARAAFGMALSMSPADADLLLLLAQAQLKSGYPGQAVTSLKEAQKKKPGDPAIDRLLVKARAEAASAPAKRPPPPGPGGQPGKDQERKK